MQQTGDDPPHGLVARVLDASDPVRREKAVIQPVGPCLGIYHHAESARDQEGSDGGHGMTPPPDHDQVDDEGGRGELDGRGQADEDAAGPVLAHPDHVDDDQAHQQRVYLSEVECRPDGFEPDRYRKRRCRDRSSESPGLGFSLVRKQVYRDHERDCCEK
jgi:hypothetical protein